MSYYETISQFVAAWKEILSFTTQLVIIIGVPIGIYQYYQAKRKERKEREYEAYHALDGKYLEYQGFCFDHPDLDIYDIQDKKPILLKGIQKKQELIAFTMLFSIFERAHFMYSDQATKIKEKQWKGWDEFIESFCKRKNFVNAWRASGNTFDADFQNYMTVKIESTTGNGK